MQRSPESRGQRPKLATVGCTALISPGLALVRPNRTEINPDSSSNFDPGNAMLDLGTTHGREPGPMLLNPRGKLQGACLKSCVVHIHVNVEAKRGRNTVGK